jgi:hypothetical protein
MNRIKIIGDLIEKQYNKIILVIGLLFFTFLFAICWVFFKERMLSFDPSFFAFQMIDQKDFFFPLGRWGSVFIEALPLLALKNNCSLSTFLHIFSVSPILIYFIIFLITTIGLKNYRAGLALLISLCIAFRHAFYYTTAELYIGIALSILLWAIIAPTNEYQTTLKKRLAFLSSLLLIYVMSYLHQLTLFTIMFVLIAELIGNKRFKDKMLWSIIIVTVGWYLIRIFVFTHSEYENEKIPSLKIFLEQLPLLYDLPSTIYFQKFAPSQLWSLFLVYGICLAYLLKMKKWLYFLFLPLFSIAFLILILITYYKGESPLMYENYYTVFGVFAAVTLLFVLYANWNKKWILLFIVPLLIINLKGVYNGHYILTKKMNYLDNLVSYGRKQEKKKFLINNLNYPWQISWVSWSLPFETTIYSALKSPDSVVTVFLTNDMNKYDSLINVPNIFLGPDFAITEFASNKLYQNYFHFPSSGYQKLNTPQTDTTFNEALFNKTNVQLIPQKEVYYTDADSFLMLPIRIKNGTGKKIYSIPLGVNPTLLSYHIYDKQGNMIEQNGKRTNLYVDVLDDFTQQLNVRLPKQKGEYRVEVDILTELKRWWGINSSFTLVVR